MPLRSWPNRFSLGMFFGLEFDLEAAQLTNPKPGFLSLYFSVCLSSILFSIRFLKNRNLKICFMLFNSSHKMYLNCTSLSCVPWCCLYRCFLGGNIGVLLHCHFQYWTIQHSCLFASCKIEKKSPNGDYRTVAVRWTEPLKFSLDSQSICCKKKLYLSKS